MKRFYMILTVGLLLSTSLLAQNTRPGHDWTVQSTSYNSNMTLIVQVQRQGVLDPNLEIGAFCGSECRGTATSHYESMLDKYLWYFVIHGDTDDELTFYVREGGVELDLETTYAVTFSPYVVVGSLTAPQVIDFVSKEAHDYFLVTDASQLIAGRNYFIGCHNGDSVAAMGKMNGGKRTMVNITVEQHKAHLAPAIMASDGESVFSFTLGGVSGAWTLYDGVSGGYLEDRSNNQDLFLSATHESSWSVSVAPDGTATVWNGTNGHYLSLYDNEGFYCSDSPQGLLLFAQCEIVSGDMASLNVTDNASMYVVPSGSTLSVGELQTVNASNLIVEDGAQLVNASAGVLATLQKSIVAYQDVDVADGYYTIASPLASGPVASCSNLATPDYDLYEYDETNLTDEEWRNYKYPGNFEGFTAGRGYLYANSNDITANMFGTLNASNVSLDLTYTDARPDSLKGFNLIGNPFPHTIYKGSGAAIDDSRLADGYYVLSNDGMWQVKTCTDAILPGTGIMVVASESFSLNIAKTTAAATGESGGAKRGMEFGKGRISLCVSDGTRSDAAYLYGAEEGRNLRKMSHMNTLCPELSFQCEGERYAIAHIDGGESTVDVRFDHQSAATCTMTWDVADWHGSHPYLVDNITGTVIDMARMSSYAFEAGSHEHPFRFKLVLDDSFEAPGLVISNLEGEGIAQIIDMNGRLIFTQEFNSSLPTPHSSLLTPHSSLAPGVYILRIISGNQVSTQKIVF